MKKERLVEILSLLVGYATTVECPSDAIPEIYKTATAILAEMKPDWEEVVKIPKKNKGAVYHFGNLFDGKIILIQITEVKE